MLTVALALAPVFLLICTGYALRRGGIPSEEFWNLNDRLVYFVLMPALFFVRIAEADLSAPGLAAFAGVLYAGFFVAAAFGIAAALWLRRGMAVGTSVLQGAARFNTFVGLAVAEALYGATGLELAVLGAAVLVPVVNLTMVAVFVIGLPQRKGGALRGAVAAFFANPLILSILAGLAVGAMEIGRIPVITDTLEVLGQAALPIMLLCVGASLKLRGLRADAAPVVLAALGKLAVFPLAILAVSTLMGLSAEAAAVALIYGALPTGVAAYTLSRQMGGDAPLMATMITFQTLLSFAVMPIWLTLAG
jgi:malonate transporter